MMSSFAGGQRRNDRVRLHSMCQDFTNVAKALSKVKGSKQVVLFSEGFDPSLIVGSSDSQDQLRFGESQERGETWDIEGRDRSGDAALQAAVDSMLEEFRHADATIQAVDISPSGSSGRSGTRRRGGVDGLHMLARGTGGELYRSSNDLPATFQRVLDQTGVYYVLFFQPDDLDPDGSYHKLKIRLRDAPRGSKATYRQGYFAPSRPAQSGFGR
jgi:VWFA-related protein